LRPTWRCRATPWIRITDHHGFHPSLAPLVGRSGKRASSRSVQGIGYPEATQQHYRDIESAFTACDGEQFSERGLVDPRRSPHPGRGGSPQ
jgi:hypothetical protein